MGVKRMDAGNNIQAFGARLTAHGEKGRYMVEGVGIRLMV
jgi:hypothetical protein